MRSGHRIEGFLSYVAIEVKLLYKGLFRYQYVQLRQDYRDCDRFQKVTLQRKHCTGELDLEFPLTEALST
jgi:hypothetical protein